MTESVVKKLEEAFAIGCSDEEACFYADISKQTLYTYQDKTPGFVDRKESLKQRPVMLARQTVVKNITTDSKLAFDYLKAKRRDEFATRSELTGADGGPIKTQTLADLVVGASNDTDPPTDPTSPSDLASATE